MFGLTDKELQGLDPIAIVQSLSHVWLFITPWTAARQASLSSTVSWSLLKLVSMELMMASNHFILFCPLLPSFPPAFNFFQHQVFSNELVFHIRWTNYWNFSFSISPSNEYSKISFRIDWFDLLAVKSTLKSLPQNHNSKALILQHSAFFMLQLSHPYTLLEKL